MELSLSGIARITGKSERTIARWIQNRQIAATRLGNGMYDVDEQALTRLRPQDENTLVLIHLEEIAARLDALEAGQARLEQGLEAIQTMLATRPFKQIAPRQSSAPVPRSQNMLPVQHSLLNDEDGTQGNQPASTISLADLATALGISRTTLLGHVLKAENGLEHIAIASETRPSEFKRYFTDDQAQAVKRWHAARSKKRPAQEE